MKRNTIREKSAAEMRSEAKKRRGLLFKTAMLGFTILVVGSLALSLLSLQNGIGLQVIPAAPGQNGLTAINMVLTNTHDDAMETSYALYADGQPVASGKTTLAAGESKALKYVSSAPLNAGDYHEYLLTAKSPYGTYEKIVAYPIETGRLSTFIAFAAASPEAIGSSGPSLSSMAYYDNAFATNKALNVGFIVAIVLIALLIYMELSGSLITERRNSALGSLRTRFSRLSSVLFVIFLAMVTSQVALFAAAGGM